MSEHAQSNTETEQTVAPQRQRLRTPGAAAYCGLSVAVMRKLRSRGGGPLFMVLSSTVVYDSGDLDRWMESRLRPTTDGARKGIFYPRKAKKVGP